jgi:hypothetical protein
VDARVRKSFKVHLGVSARANVKGTSVVLGGRVYVALALLALVLTACEPFSNAEATSRTPSRGPTAHPTYPVTRPDTSPTSAPAPHRPRPVHLTDPSPDTSPTSAAPTSTSPTSAAPTSTSPTSAAPTSTSPTSAAPTGTVWACVTSSPNGTCGDYNTGSTNSNGYNSYVANNCWADPTCQQTLSANSFGDWQVTANEPAGNGSVKTAPEAQQQFNNWCPGSKTWSNLVPNGCSNEGDTPISALSQLTSTYAESTPHNGQTIAQWAWDNWLDNDSGYPDEVMIWVDNNGRCNSGSLGTQVHAPVTIAGQEWTPYQYDSTEFIWSLDGSGGAGTCAQQASGTVDVLALLNWMQANGHAAAGATLDLLDGLFEICSTGGAPETFGVSSYSVAAKPS